MGTCPWLAVLTMPVPTSIGLPSSRSLVPSRGSRQAVGLGCLTFSFLPPRADCRYTCHQECRSLIQLDCRRPGQCQSQLSPESTLLPPCTQVRRGGGSAGGVDSLMVTDRISFRDLISCSRRVLQEEGLGREVSPSVLQTQAGLANELPV